MGLLKVTEPIADIKLGPTVYVSNILASQKRVKNNSFFPFRLTFL